MKRDVLQPRALSLSINGRQEKKLREFAQKCGLPFNVYCQNLFDAAYAAKVGVCQDTDLDGKLRVALILFGAGVSEKRIGEVIGCSTATAIKLIDATRNEIRIRLAARDE